VSALNAEMGGRTGRLACLPTVYLDGLVKNAAWWECGYDRRAAPREVLAKATLALPVKARLDVY
jgi:hypothetical protein